MDQASRKAQITLPAEQKIAQDESGQTFVEFLFLLLSIMGLSYLLLGGISKGIGKRWVVLVEAITAPTDDNVELE